jgi:fructose-1,6-bisphosphatase
MKSDLKWYFWYPIMDGCVGPFNTKREARKFVREHASPYQRKHAYYFKSEDHTKQEKPKEE